MSVAVDHDEAADGLAHPARRLAAATLLLMINMTVLEGTMINIALPIIARNFAITPSLSIWMFNAY